MHPAGRWVSRRRCTTPSMLAQRHAQLRTAALMWLGPQQRRAAQATSWQPARGCCRPARARFRTRCDTGAPRTLTLRLARLLVQGFCRGAPRPGCRALIRRTARSVPWPARARVALVLTGCGATSNSGRRMKGGEARRKLGRGGASDHGEGVGPQRHAAQPAEPPDNNRRLACRAVVPPGRQPGFRGGLEGSRRRALGRASAGRGTCARGMRRPGRSTSAQARASGRG